MYLIFTWEDLSSKIVFLFLLLVFLTVKHFPSLDVDCDLGKGFPASLFLKFLLCWTEEEMWCT